MLTSIQVKIAAVCKWGTHQRPICTLSSPPLQSKRARYEISSANHHAIHRTSMAHSQKGWITLSTLIAKIVLILGSFSWTWRINMIRSPYRHRNHTIKDQQKEEVPSWKRDTLGFIHSLGTGTQDTYNLSHSYPDPYWIVGMRNDQSSRDHKKSPTPGLTSHHKFTTNMAGTCN
jgi:hypothetical protein